MRLEVAGDRFGRYRLVELIGRGGMAEVFRATNPARGAGGRGFVIKRIRPDKSDSPRFVQMFCDEARISALLHHPNIVQTYDFGHIDGAYFMAMELLEGRDLQAVLRGLRARRALMPPAVAGFVAREVARALDHAHTATLPGGEPGGIVHRDVSPSNIMLLRSDGVKILDFGIAKAASLARPVDEGSGNRPKVQGHLGYLSPEQILGTEVDQRSDLFSLGVVLWEMLAGVPLFAGKDEFETMRNVLRLPVPSGAGRGRVPPALQAILARALNRDLGGRYPTAAAMADDLDRFLRETPCPTGAVSALLQQLFGASGVGGPEGSNAARPVLTRRVERSGRTIVAAVAGVAVLMALMGGWWVRSRGDQSSSARSVSTSR